jgi:hypothetical protein
VIGVNEACVVLEPGAALSTPCHKDLLLAQTPRVASFSVKPHTVRISTNRNEIKNLLASVGAVFSPDEDAICSWALRQFEGGRLVTFDQPKR